MGPTGPAGLDGTGADNQTAAEVTVDATGFTSGNLETTDDTVQKVAQKVHDLSLGDTGTLPLLPRPATAAFPAALTAAPLALVVNLPGLPNSSSIVSTGTLAGATGGGSSVEYSVAAVSAYVQAQSCYRYRP